MSGYLQFTCATRHGGVILHFFSAGAPGRHCQYMAYFGWTPLRSIRLSKEQTVSGKLLLQLCSVDSDEPYCPRPRNLPAPVKVIFQQHDSITIFESIRLQASASAIPSRVSFKPVPASLQPYPNPDFHRQSSINF